MVVFDSQACEARNMVCSDGAGCNVSKPGCDDAVCTMTCGWWWLVVDADKSRLEWSWGDDGRRSGGG